MSDKTNDWKDRWEESQGDLRASEERFRNIIEKNADGIVIVDREGYIRFVNPAAERLLGYPSDQLLGEMFGFPTVVDETTELDIVSNRELRVAEMRVVDTDWEGTPVYLASLRDVTARKQAEEDFQHLVLGTSSTTGHMFFKTLVRELSTWLGVRWALISEIDRETGTTCQPLAFYEDGKIGLMPPYEMEDTPCDQVRQQGFCIFLDNVAETFPDDTDLIEMGVRWYAGIALKDGKGEPVGILCAFHDEPVDPPLNVREMFAIFSHRAGAEIVRRHTQNQLKEYTEHLEDLVAAKVRELEMERVKTIHTAKLAALGEMATGVAHELNQPLTSMLFEADYLKTVTHKALREESAPFSLTVEELYQIADDLSQDIERCRRIIDHLRAFGRVSEGRATSVDLNRTIKDSFILIGERLRQHDIDVQMELAPDLPPIIADPNRMEQVFINLISNAEYAMEEMARRIKEHKVKRSDYRKELHIATSLEHDVVVARVSDNGCGIPLVYNEHIFEPFFTTKKVGEGTGLGLSISYGIVTEYGGEITFESVENEGTTFTLRFPLKDEA